MLDYARDFIFFSFIHHQSLTNIQLPNQHLSLVIINCQVLVLIKIVKLCYVNKDSEVMLDNAREYFKSNLGSYLSDQGIIHISSCVNTPQ